MLEREKRKRKEGSEKTNHKNNETKAPNENRNK
jgi:hypothetical protein